MSCYPQTKDTVLKEPVYEIKLHVDLFNQQRSYEKLEPIESKSYFARNMASIQQNRRTISQTVIKPDPAAILSKIYSTVDHPSSSQIKFKQSLKPIRPLKPLRQSFKANAIKQAAIKDSENLAMLKTL